MDYNLKIYLDVETVTEKKYFHLGLFVWLFFSFFLLQKWMFLEVKISNNFQKSLFIYFKFLKKS